ncbi:MAG: uridine kinase family protein [Jatrophihabitans sp.]
MASPVDLYPLAELTAAIASAPARCGQVRVLAIDGGAAAGKSGLAGALAGLLPGAPVLHTDDLLDGWSGQSGYADRLREGVLGPLAAGRPGSYRRYDWTAGRFAEQVSVPLAKVLIVEGVCAIDSCAPLASLGIFIDVARAVRLRRWIDRDGPPQQAWLDWLDGEDRYFAEHPPQPGTIVLAG